MRSLILSLLFCWRYGLLAITLVMTAPSPAKAETDAPVIAAASDLQFVLAEIAAAFTADTGYSIRLSLGATGNLARQIREGAPFDLFLAADEQFVLDLHRDGLTKDEGTLYALGSVVLMAPHGSPLAHDPTLEGLRKALAAGQITRFAIANPEHAPYGLRAQQALVAANLWDDLRPFLVMGENVSQAAAFAVSGNAEGGLIALSLALAPQLVERGRFSKIPHALHSPLRQRMVRLPGAGPVAEEFYMYLQQPAARATFERFGFALP